MATAIIMPRQGQSVESCIITAWNKKVGDKVEKGDVLFSYETDKSSFEEPAPEAGVLLAIFREEGDDVPCLETVCVIGAEGEDFSALVPAGEAAPAEAAPAEAAPAAAPAEAAPAAAEVAPTAAATGAMSPRACILADKTGADLLKATPTGPNGRIIERDVEALLDKGLTVSPAAATEYKSAVEGTGISGKVVLSDLAPKAAAEAAPAAVTEAAYVDEKLPNIRKIIAKQMCASLTGMAQLTFNSSFDATKLLALRKSLKAGAEKMGLANITLNDIILYAVSRVLRYPKHRGFNAHCLDDKMRYFSSVNLGIAVDTERGLMVPTVFAADKMSLNEISKSSKAVITAAQNGNINPDLLTGATFTVSNLGSLGIESFTPIINPPQTAILGVDCVTRRLKEVDGEDVVYPAMGLSLTVDHRVLDGADAARFLQDVGFALENIDLLMAK
ncbi:MAG: 2-oxo acid dehydrogenase subunit E2 [Clostridia bacterium]|nr:2-oxo acid dehydrogenase subunit E2 [Clostridia bacterium]